MFFRAVTGSQQNWMKDYSFCLSDPRPPVPLSPGTVPTRQYPHHSGRVGEPTVTHCCHPTSIVTSGFTLGGVLCSSLCLLWSSVWWPRPELVITQNTLYLCALYLPPSIPADSWQPRNCLMMLPFGGSNHNTLSDWFLSPRNVHSWSLLVFSCLDSSSFWCWTVFLEIIQEAVHWPHLLLTDNWWKFFKI